MTTAALLVFSLTLSGSMLAGESASKDAEEVQATVVAMWDAIEKKDLERYASYVHPDFSVFGENDVYLASGKDLEVRNMADYFQRTLNVHTEMHQPQVTIVGGVAWVVYYWTESGVLEGNRFTSRGKSTRIFVKQDGKWLCIHGHYTAVP